MACTGGLSAGKAVRLITVSLPSVDWSQLQVSHPGSDDDGLSFFRLPTVGTEVWTLSPPTACARSSSRPNLTTGASLARRANGGHRGGMAPREGRVAFRRVELRRRRRSIRRGGGVRGGARGDRDSGGALNYGTSVRVFPGREYARGGKPPKRSATTQGRTQGTPALWWSARCGASPSDPCLLAERRIGRC